MNLSDSVSALNGIGQYTKARLKLLDIITVYDLLYHLPARYIDYSLISKISNLQEGEVATIHGEVVKISNNYLRGKRLTIQRALLSDDSGSIGITWFNQQYLLKNLQNKEINVSGEITKFGSKLTMNSPDFEINNEQPIHTARLVPVYPQTQGISSKWLRAKIAYCLQNLRITDLIPKVIIDKENLMPLSQAFSAIHFPKSNQDVPPAKKRLAFDEIFYLQLIGALRRRQWRQEKKANRIDTVKFNNEIDQYIKSLPFQLTSSQKIAVDQILADLNKSEAMNRMLQGDVGSGKTVVASIAVYAAFLNGKKSVLMAPTEILALQHYQTLNQFLVKKAVKIALVTSSTKTTTRKSDLYIGTHALLHRNRMLDNLGLLVIDEQHRFGVEQRAILRQQKVIPHFLSMTATPIPRTVALTLYGELDMSVIDELPNNRKPIKTFLVGKEKYDKALHWVKQKIIDSKIVRQPEQAFIIYPLIEESENLTELKAAEQEYLKLKKFFSPQLSVALMHGRMKTEEKKKIISEFGKGTVNILVSTSLIEVGIDIPAATIMIVENAERFGLAQLHQMRGRVGRGDKQSYCLLFGSSNNSRLKALERIRSGIKLAEMDLKIRGGGDIYGILQHGRVKLKAADLSDTGLLESARFWALKLTNDDKFAASYQKLYQSLGEDQLKKIMPD